MMLIAFFKSPRSFQAFVAKTPFFNGALFILGLWVLNNVVFELLSILIFSKFCKKSPTVLGETASFPTRKGQNCNNYMSKASSGL